MNTQAMLVAIAIIASFIVAATTTPVSAQSMTGGKNMTAAMDDNMTQPLEDANMTTGR
jgi:multidrug efflux pump subunit AcrB